MPKPVNPIGTSYKPWGWWFNANRTDTFSPGGGVDPGLEYYASGDYFTFTNVAAYASSSGDYFTINEAASGGKITVSGDYFTAV